MKHDPVQFALQALVLAELDGWIKAAAGPLLGGDQPSVNWGSTPARSPTLKPKAPQPVAGSRSLGDSNAGQLTRPSFAPLNTMSPATMPQFGSTPAASPSSPMPSHRLTRPSFNSLLAPAPTVAPNPAPAPMTPPAQAPQPATAGSPWAMPAGAVRQSGSWTTPMQVGSTTRPVSFNPSTKQSLEASMPGYGSATPAQRGTMLANRPVYGSMGTTVPNAKPNARGETTNLDGSIDVNPALDKQRPQSQWVSPNQKEVMIDKKYMAPGSSGVGSVTFGQPPPTSSTGRIAYQGQDMTKQIMDSAAQQRKVASITRSFRDYLT